MERFSGIGANPIIVQVGILPSSNLAIPVHSVWSYVCQSHNSSMSISQFLYNDSLMKRCPQCLFIYPESDERCDFDNTLLAVVDEAEIEAATTPVIMPTTRNLTTTQSGALSRAQSRKALPVAAVVGLTLGLMMFVVYYGFSQQVAKAPVSQGSNHITSDNALAPQPNVTVSSPSPTTSPLPEESPAAAPRPSSTRTSTSYSSASSGPVSTSGPGMGSRQGGRPVILLSAGGRIEADEVWRTRDGVWYRRDGVVTLLKRGRVKAIVNR